jgi:tRNA A37 threonylcarbamoyladenosine dehydratase
MDEKTLRVRMLLGETAMERLRASHVAVFGLGGVGSWCAEALCRSGVGRLTLIDRDTVSESNRNRQLCALGSTVGLPKAEVMAARLRDANPGCAVRPIPGHYDAADRERFLADYDYVVDCIDLVSCKLDLILSCRERGIPVVSALGTGNKKDASLLRLDDIANTYGCALARVMRKELRARGVEHHPVVFSPEEPVTPEPLEAPEPGRRSVPGSLVWVPATAGMLLCQHVVLALSEKEPVRRDG